MLIERPQSLAKAQSNPAQGLHDELLREDVLRNPLIRSTPPAGHDRLNVRTIERDGNAGPKDEGAFTRIPEPTL